MGSHCHRQGLDRGIQVVCVDGSGVVILYGQGLLLTGLPSVVFNRPGVAGAVLQTRSSLTQ